MPQQPAGQWPQAPQGYDDYQGGPPQPPAQGGYHFPPPDPQPAYGYSNVQMMAAQQWPQQAEPQPYDVNYQAYSDTDPSPFAQGHVQHHGYADSDAEFDGYYEDEEPRRGRRWLLIAAALIGAIGVGGALAYTYRSIVAPHSRLLTSKSAPVKVTVPVKEEPPAPPKVAAVDPPAPPPAEDPPSGGSDGIRTVKTFTISPGGGPPPSTVPPSTLPSPPSSIPGLSIYKPPEGSVPPPPAPPVKEIVPPSGGRVVIGKPPPPTPPKEEVQEDDTEVAPPPPPMKKPPHTASLAPKVPSPPPAPKPPPSSGLGFVPVLKSAKSHMDAMTAYADLQQKYPDVLGGKSFDVQEVDLSARGLGTMYRVVVGPPGSHHAASEICAQLKAAGYVGCWVKEF